MYLLYLIFFPSKHCRIVLFIFSIFGFNYCTIISFMYFIILAMYFKIFLDFHFRVVVYINFLRSQLIEIYF